MSSPALEVCFRDADGFVLVHGAEHLVDLLVQLVLVPVVEDGVALLLHEDQLRELIRIICSKRAELRLDGAVGGIHPHVCCITRRELRSLIVIGVP